MVVVTDDRCTSGVSVLLLIEAVVRVLAVAVITGDVVREDVSWLLIEAVVRDVVVVVVVVVVSSGVQSSAVLGCSRQVLCLCVMPLCRFLLVVHCTLCVPTACTLHSLCPYCLYTTLSVSLLLVHCTHSSVSLLLVYCTLCVPVACTLHSLCPYCLYAALCPYCLYTALSVSLLLAHCTYSSVSLLLVHCTLCVHTACTLHSLCPYCLYAALCVPTACTLHSLCPYCLHIALTALCPYCLYTALTALWAAVSLCPRQPTESVGPIFGL